MQKIIFNREIVWIRERFTHHGNKSGYDQLCESLQNIILSRVYSIWHNDDKAYQKWQIRLLEKLRKIANGSPYVNYKRTATELKAVLYKPLQKQIIHITYGESHLGLLKYRIFKQKSKVVLTIHQPQEWWKEHNIPESYFNNVDALIVLSKEEFSYFNTILPGKVYFIPHGIDTNFFRPQPKDKINEKIEQNKKSCVTVGNWLRDFKTLEKVIKRISTIDKTIYFDIVIPDFCVNIHPHKEALNRILKLENVRWHNRISDFELKNLYHKTNLLLLSLLEGTANNSILEAVSSGLPIIATNVGGIKDYTQNDFSFLINPKDHMSMANAVLDIINSPEEQLLKSEKARKFAVNNLSWDVIAKQIIDIYYSLDD